MNNTSILLENGSRIQTPEYNHEYYLRNKEKLRVSNKKYRRERFGYVGKQKIKNSKEFRENRRKYHKKWANKNKERLKKYQQERKNKSYGGMWEIILKRDNYKCQVCGTIKIKKKGHLGLHHYNGNRKDNSYWNLLTLCPACHRSHHNGLF